MCGEWGGGLGWCHESTGDCRLAIDILGWWAGRTPGCWLAVASSGVHGVGASVLSLAGAAGVHLALGLTRASVVDFLWGHPKDVERFWHDLRAAGADSLVAG